MGIFRSISMAALRFVLLFALCVGVLSKIDRLEADIEDPADMADEFLNQMSYDKLDKDQDQGQMIASELQGLNDVASQTEDVSHPDMGESADVDVQVSEGVAQCNGDQECIDTVHAVVSSLGESMSARRRRRKIACKDSNSEICSHKKLLCEHGTHGEKVVKECPMSCGICATLDASRKCEDKAPKCEAVDGDKQCHVVVIKQTCKKPCGNCKESVTT